MKLNLMLYSSTYVLFRLFKSPKTSDLVDVKVKIWIHLLSRQPFSRQLVAQNRSLNKAAISISGNEVTRKGLR